MVYLNVFTFPNEDMEFDFFMKVKRTCYDVFYPFKILSRHGFERIDFEPVTILYGGNGSGKSTALNVIAEKIGINRDSIYNKSNFYPDYIHMCEMQLEADIPENSRIITSDDVFDYMLNIRNLNEGIDQKREKLFEEYLDAKYSHFLMKSLSDYEQLKKVNMARSKTQSRFVRNELMANVRGYSNGESAFVSVANLLKGIEVCRHILKTVNSKLADQPKQLSISIGVEVTFNREPVRYYLEMVERQLKCAKKASRPEKLCPFLDGKIAINGLAFFDIDYDKFKEHKKKLKSGNDPEKKDLNQKKFNPRVAVFLE